MLKQTVPEGMWESKAGETKGQGVKAVDNALSGIPTLQSKANLAIITL